MIDEQRALYDAIKAQPKNTQDAFRHYDKGISNHLDGHYTPNWSTTKWNGIGGCSDPDAYYGQPLRYEFEINKTNPTAIS